MKRSCRKKAAANKSEPTPDQIRNYIQCMSDDHQLAWRAELMSSAPYWVYLLGLHLRMCELEHMESAVGELL